MKEMNFHQTVPLENQIRFSLVNVFRESEDLNRNFTLPFNMISICTRADDEDAGVITNLEDGEIFHLHENDITLVTCNLSQHIRCTTGSERYGIHFKLELYPGVDVFSSVKCRVVENSPELRKEADEIFAIDEPVLKLARCTDFALRFCFKHWPAQYHFKEDESKKFLPLLQNLQERVTAQLRVEDLAIEMHCSNDGFTRHFRGLFHKTPKQYLQEALFRRAAFLLLAPDETVKSVSDKLEFSSEFNFSRFFKRLSGGLSPSEYRASYLYKS